jgi:hypothetical protein
LRQTSKEEAEEWAKEQGLLFLEASAKDGTNVDEIFMQIGEFLLSFLKSHAKWENDRERLLISCCVAYEARKLPLSTSQSRDPAAAKGKGVKLANNGPASASACQC